MFIPTPRPHRVGEILSGSRQGRQVTPPFRRQSEVDGFRTFRGKSQLKLQTRLR
ncbi:hypothetical protein RHOER0001_1015 [Rhodococcus erythropolis SK121]|nr:hypothetical protein RHOER0001_1015 [Rhodococcus erythropolis SK121]